MSYYLIFSNTIEMMRKYHHLQVHIGKSFAKDTFAYAKWPWLWFGQLLKI